VPGVQGGDAGGGMVGVEWLGKGGYVVVEQDAAG
jgi:hypothetical protein